MCERWRESECGTGLKCNLFNSLLSFFARTSWNCVKAIGEISFCGKESPSSRDVCSKGFDCLCLEVFLLTFLPQCNERQNKFSRQGVDAGNVFVRLEMQLKHSAVVWKLERRRHRLMTVVKRSGRGRKEIFERDFLCKSFFLCLMLI